ncbi:MAG: cytochrome C biogenesis protein, partial [Verrucomicrobia bacterium]|nr:cytochrome C biogenesis protein [Verrucomicrobiota bacterium]
VAFAGEDKAWAGAKMVRIVFKPLKQRLGLPEQDNYFSYQELAANPKLNEIYESLRKPKPMTANPTAKTRDLVESEANALFSRLNDLTAIGSRESLKMVPHPSDPNAPWAALGDTERLTSYYPQKAKDVQTQFAALAAAYRKGDAAGFASATEQLGRTLRELSPQIYPAPDKLGLEISYNRLQPFRWAWISALASLLVFVVTVKTQSRTPYWFGLAIFIVAIVMQAAGFTFRSMIAGRAPVTNMYESVVWASFGVALFGLIFELIHRARYFAIGASAFMGVALLLAEMFPNALNPSIQPLPPVLRDNFWLSVHVITIMFGYAGFGLAYSVGHVSLGYHLWKPTERQLLDTLTRYTYRVLQIGVLLLAAGIGLGGLWANYSWGRFWGWDPKETWSLIALLSYLVVLHGRFSGWLTSFSLNVAACVCFNSILMAWYGVNFVLGTGLHSYGFGT